MTSPTASTYHIKGVWLMLARSGWVILTLIAISVLIVALVGIYTGWRTPCSALPLTPDKLSSCIDYDQTFRQFGLSRDFNSIYFLIGVLVEVLPWILTGIVIFWKKSDEPFGLLFSLMLVLVSTFIVDEGIVANALFFYPIPPPLIQGMVFIGGSLLILWYRFPDGHFVLPWLRWVAIVWVGIQAGRNIFTDTPFNADNLPYPWSDGINALFTFSAVYSLVYRYRHTSDLLQKQQIKRVVLSVSVMAIIYTTRFLFDVLVNLGLMIWDIKTQVIWSFTYVPILYFGMMFVGVSLGFSILRYRLWDIDFIINRSLVYGALTVLLALVFGSSLFLVSRIVEGQNFILAFGITALIAGISFNPTRRRIQRFVDQRFYHINIDYQKTPLDIPSRSATQILRGTKFGVYQDLELIGRGGMGEVYKSTHPELHTPVAIKILPDQFTDEAEFRQRFTREAQVVSKLEHPNIIRVFDSGEQNGKYYMVMEYLSSKDLDRLLKSKGRLSMQEVLPIIQQIASALDFAHNQGFVHRDIKPSNILIDMTTSTLRAVLTDFGIAKIMNAHTAMTRTGNVMGTFDYIAPEQIQESNTIDGRADIYALGVMVYQMLAGEMPFKQVHPGALLIAHLTQPPPDICQVNIELPENVCHAIQRSMAKNPDERYATALEFVSALQ